MSSSLAWHYKCDAIVRLLLVLLKGILSEVRCQEVVAKDSRNAWVAGGGAGTPEDALYSVLLLVVNILYRTGRAID